MVLRASSRTQRGRSVGAALSVSFVRPLSTRCGHRASYPSRMAVDLDCSKSIALIGQARNCRLPVLVGVDGRSGAGKSTFCAALAAASCARLIEGDAFYAGGIELRGDTAEQRAQACIDRPKLRGVLESLKSGRAATFRAFDWEAFDGRLSDETLTIQPAEIVIVEGVYACHPDFADLLDIRLLLVVAEPVRERRLLQREGKIGPWERQWHEAEDWYFANLASADTFDLVIG